MHEQSVSLNLLGGGANPTEHFSLHDHMPFRQPWRDGYVPSKGAVAMVETFMGAGYPPRSIVQEIMDALEHFSARHETAKAAIAEYFSTIGPRGVTILKALRRNFHNHPERWEGI